MSQSPAEKLAREIAREAGHLPEHWRLWLFEQLSEDFEIVDPEKLESDLISARMSSAIRALLRVADHLGRRDREDQLRLTMREFDAAPEVVREGWRARRIADVIRGSWMLAKGVAFAGQRLPVVSEVSWKRAEGLGRKRREGAFTLAGIGAWLDTNPKKKSRNAYDDWVKAHNRGLKKGEKRLPQGKALWNRWRVPLAEIFKAVEENRIPGEKPEAAPSKASSGRAGYQASQAPLRSLNLDLGFQGQLIRAARESLGVSCSELANMANVDASQIAKIEKGQVRGPTFKTLAKLAFVLGLSLDELAAGPPSS